MITLEQDGGIARVTLRRPEARNAIPIARWADLAACVSRAGESARVILLGGEGPAFSAGADLHEMAALVQDVAGRAALRAAMREGIGAILASRVPVVAAIDGGCFGAGVALALACDIRVAGPRARFGLPPARFGLSYPQEDIARLVARVGQGQASRLLLTAETIDAAEAARIGLIDVLADDQGEGVARAIAGNVPESVALLRRKIGGIEADEADAAFDACFDSAAFAATAAGIRERRG
ncbi:enoyl-CoA hydratase/isomerase family protein [Sphingomonas sp. BIUV-7]|uniref:Enoyl-CoA hydratase/isomerase family protein n=1 Tax=Sphingomonas natans TaxID=3063330 RepID=A0ABT8Y9Y1_9SPHN|nr:enoyl-CoA hydratase/isomerase family protein [Sphingomonas sp. BIUV-7]MDO6415130.1 enoyl-CoA hydratase/isomerase family protein [Sphingomonas sp. BIUV-7]